VTATARERTQLAQAGGVPVVFVEGRRPGSGETVIFDEVAAEVEPGGVSWARLKGRAVAMAATEGVRGYATSSVRGRKRRRRETQRGGASADAPQDRAGSSSGLASGLRSRMSGSESRRYAEAGALPSSEAPPEDLLEVIGRRWISTKRRGRKVRWLVHPGIGQSRGCLFRESVAEVGEAHLSGQTGLRGNSQHGTIG